jgi:hypothetical protein
MDRIIVYPASIPLDTDLLNTNRNTLIALGALAQATLGAAPVVDGLSIAPTLPASMAITIAPGSITQLSTLDQNAYGSLPADATEPLLKMGINLTPTTLTLTAPALSGQAISYLIEAAFVESDAAATVLPYYNAANPTQPFLGPNNTGVAQATSRIERVQFQVKSGGPGLIGQQMIPTADAGWSPLAVVTVQYGQTQITAAAITPAAQAPLLAFKLPDLRPGFAQIQSFTATGWFSVPAGVTRVKVSVTGGGGAGGTHATLPGGGGGAGGSAMRVITGLTSGSAVWVTVGSGGAPVIGSTGNGGNGGASSFGTYVSATGGSGGGGGTASIAAGGAGGAGVGGDVNLNGGYGTDCILSAGRGGDGGGPGNGRGSTGPTAGIAAPGPGGGGGGGGASNTQGTGIGSPGGAGGNGLVIIEY